ncbi:MAG: hypothetical protein Q4E12_07195 [Coriobacteriia bacterium]|nr:hypothetical protein [Coriobacteriia bacterium]
MSFLDGFEPIKRIKGVASMSVSKDGVSFTTAVIEKMGKPRYVTPLIDRNTQRFAIVSSDTETDDTRLFYKEGRKSQYGIRWSDRDIRSTLGEMMGWNLEESGYRVAGFFDYDDNAFIFDLKEAKPYGKGAAKGEED